VAAVREQTYGDLVDLCNALQANIREVKAENEKLARALAAAPTSIEERKVAALEEIAQQLRVFNDNPLEITVK